MKIKGENTIPSGRQFENFKFSYEIEIEDGEGVDDRIDEARFVIRQKLIDDMDKLKDYFFKKETANA